MDRLPSDFRSYPDILTSEAWSWEITYQIAGEPEPITDWELELVCRPNATADIFVRLWTGDSTIVIADGPSGVFRFNRSRAAMGLLRPTLLALSPRPSARVPMAAELRGGPGGDLQVMSEGTLYFRAGMSG